jgi:pimeloyl-ACP methyl ester carboxylesterase
MKLDIASYHGSIDKPAIVFIHGLGMDKNIWVNPSESRILGGMFPLRILLDKKNTVENVEKIQTLFDDLRQRDYSVITWSQRRPAGPIDSAVKELHEIIIEAQKMTKAGIILIGHSRGGLIARKYLFKQDKSIKGLITISTPHKGSSVAKIVKYLSPLVSMINPLVPNGDKGTLSFSIKRILDFLKSRALKELLPDSNFFKSIKDGPLKGVHYASVGGTKPTLFNLYNISFPDIFEKIIPENLYPEEMRMGKGDGLVSAESSKIPWSNEHYNFAFNHAEILFDKDVRDVLGKIIERLT